MNTSNPQKAKDYLCSGVIWAEIGEYDKKINVTEAVYY